MKSLTAIGATALLLAACSSPTSDTYKDEEVGKIITTSEGTVLSSRVVDVDGETSPAGPLVGAGAGGATGYGVSGGSGLATIVGALAGAGVGYLVESGLNDREGIEYVIKLDDGRVVTLVQNREDEEKPIEDGQPVLIQYGGTYTRVIDRPQNLDASATPAVWVNPDSLPPGVTPPGGDVDGDVIPEANKVKPAGQTESE